jgi:LysR family transcriptional regulator of beta-lactamase
MPASLNTLPLNALRSFAACARHLSFTKAAEELCVTQSAVSHQIRALEARLGVKLFTRLPRGLSLTDEGDSLLPGLTQSFDRIGQLLEQIQGGLERRPLTVGVVATFAIGWLLPRLADFQAQHPDVDLRVRTHNNKADLLAEGLDCSIHFGEGDWLGAEATRICEAPLSPLCSPRLAREIRRPADLARLPLLRSYRADEWPRWFASADLEAPSIRGGVFDSSLTMIAAAERSLGVALAPPSMFAFELEKARLIQPFPIEVDAGGYYLLRPKSRPPSDGERALLAWCRRQPSMAGNDERPSGR